jgi:hypothetical protein
MPAKLEPEPDRLVQRSVRSHFILGQQSFEKWQEALQVDNAPHVLRWDSVMIFEELPKSLFPSDLFIQPGDNNNPILSEDMSQTK